MKSERQKLIDWYKRTLKYSAPFGIAECSHEDVTSFLELTSGNFDMSVDEAIVVIKSLSEIDIVRLRRISKQRFKSKQSR